MWSASSSTVISIASRKTCLLRRWSSSRPGQATRMSTPRRRALICGPAPTPPKTVVVLSPAALARGVIAASIWLASSRVGARISARGRPDRSGAPEAASLATTGRAKARVLPEPVRPRPSTSRPARESGSVAVWIGNGVVMPSAASTRVSAAGTPSAANVVGVAAVAGAGAGDHSGGGGRGVRGAVARTGVRGAAVIRHRGTPKEREAANSGASRWSATARGRRWPPGRAAT